MSKESNGFLATKDDSPFFLRLGVPEPVVDFVDKDIESPAYDFMRSNAF